VSQAEVSKRAPRKQVPRPLLIDPNQRYSLAETNAALCQSHVKTFADIKRGKLKTILDGRRRYVLGAEIIRRSSGT
jgi:hypothetical protein